jgi:predicted protein tyrosine phosphatase
MKLLFVCSRGRLRSATAETLFSTCEGLEVLSAGTNPDAVTPLSADLIEWADIVFVMEAAHSRKMNQKFGPLLCRKRVIVLGIPDEYSYMDPGLIEILKAKVSQTIEL